MKDLNEWRTSELIDFINSIYRVSNGKNININLYTKALQVLKDRSELLAMLYF